MINYSVKPIATTFNGVRYRSRLEARWGAFFELCGWSATYEPFDLGEWTPDFILHGNTRVLVEVKPILEVDKDTCFKMERSALKADFHGDLLLVGIVPFVKTSDGLALGWLGERYTGEEEPCDWGTAVYLGYGLIDFCHGHANFHGRMTGYYDGSYEGGDKRFRPLWNEAINATQWQFNGR